MAEEEDKQEDKFDFTPEGEALGYISMDQSQVLAMRTARETPGAYGPAYVDVPMAFDVVESDDTEDHYRITISFRPEGEFAGRPGREQFIIEKEGAVALRQVLSLPVPAGGRRLPFAPAIIAVVVVGAVLVVVGIAFAGRGFSGEASSDDAAGVVTPTDTPVQTPTSAPSAPTAVPVAMVPSIGTAVPTPPPTPVPDAAVTPTPEALATPTAGPALALTTPAPGTLPLLVFQNGLPMPQLGIAEYTGVQDTYIAQGEPSTNFERETSVFAKADPVENTYGLATLIRFDLSALPKSTVIGRATLGLYRHPTAFATSATILVSELSAHVALDAVTQNNLDRSIIGPQVASFQVESLPEYRGSWHEIDITEVVRNWFVDPTNNHGLFLQQESGEGLGPEVAFFSADYTSDGTSQGKALTPKLTIRYGPMAPATTPFPTPSPVPTPSGPLSAGTFILKWGSQGNGDGQFNNPQGLAVAGSGNVYIVDSENHRIQKFDSSGNFLTKWDTPGTYGSYGVAVDSSGNVYVSDFDQLVHKFDSSGTLLAKWGTEGTGDGQFSLPTGVTVDGAGNVYVADTGNQRIQRFDSSGNFLTKWGSGIGIFNNGVAVDKTGKFVYVSDFNNHRVQKFATGN